MKATYEKPIVIFNDELAEGVYAASGADDSECYIVTANIHQRPETGRGDYRIQVNAQHITQHHGDAQTLVLYFSQPVTYIGSNGTLIAGSGSATLEIAYNYHQNGGDNIGLGDVIVQSTSGLSVTGAKVICNKNCAQHPNV